MTQTIQFGVTYPAGQQRHRDLGGYTEEVERLGFDSLWVIDNLASGSPGLECLTTLAYAAAKSRRLKIGTSVMLLPLRSPVLMTQACNTIDILSNGRLILGLGVGDAESHTAVGANPRVRGERMSEYLDLLTRLWSPGAISFSGKHLRLDDYELTPRAVQTPHPAIWIGGHSEAAVARAAKFADGFITVGESPQAAGKRFDSLDSQAKALSRPPLTRAVHLYLAFAGSVKEATEHTANTLTDRYSRKTSVGDTSAHFLGTEAQVVETAKRFMEVGVTHFILDPTCRQDAALQQATQFAEQCRNVL